MTALGLSHIALGVRDLEASLHFYCELLGGLRLVRQQQEDVGRRDGRRLVRRAAYLRFDPPGGRQAPSGGRQAPPDSRQAPPGGRQAPSGGRDDEVFLVLDEQLHDERPEPPVPLFGLGVHHLAFTVADVEETFARLTAAGVGAVIGVRAVGSERYGEDPGGVFLTAMVSDPDGFVIQIDQRATADDVADHRRLFEA